MPYQPTDSRLSLSFRIYVLIRNDFDVVSSNPTGEFGTRLYRCSRRRRSVFPPRISFQIRDSAESSEYLVQKQSGSGTP